MCVCVCVCVCRVCVCVGGTGRPGWYQVGSGLSQYDGYIIYICTEH